MHRDVKPSNLLLTGSGQIKLLDLGLVQSLDASPGKGPPSKLSKHDNESDTADPSIGWPTGTPDYMPPEQWRAASQADPRSDLYSLGCALFKLLTGAPPFRPLPEGYQDRCEAHCAAPIPAIASRRPDCPAELQSIIDRLLAKDAQQRFDSVDEFQRALRPFCRGANLIRVANLVGLQLTGESQCVPAPQSDRRPRVDAKRFLESHWG